MDPNNNKKFTRFFENSKELLEADSTYDKQFLFQLANCYLRIGRFDEAKEFYRQSLSAMFIAPKFWLDSAQVDWLVNIFVLSGNNSEYNKVVKELLSIKTTVISTYPIYSYAMCLMDLYIGQGDSSFWISKLVEKPRIKEAVYKGEAFQAILERNENNLNVLLTNLLNMHAGRAKHGVLRETAESLVCLSAMAIGFIAVKNKIPITVKSEYFSKEYLDFLLYDKK